MRGHGVCRAFASRRFCEVKKRVFQAESSRRASPIPHRKTQDDPHKLRRLRRPTGPRRAEVCAVQGQILQSDLPDGPCHPDDPMAAVYGGNVAESLIELGRFAEAKAFLPDVIAFSVSRHGANHIETLKLRWRLATSLYKCEGASISDCEEAVATLEDVIRISRRVCGTNHPTFAKAPTALESAREALARARGAAWFLIAREQHQREPGDSV